MYQDHSPEEPPSPRLPKTPLQRRIYAFCIDFASVWLLGSFFSRNWFLQSLILIFLWLVLQVVVVEKNKGQSLGRWLLDIRVIDRRFNRTPGLQELLVRESIHGGASILAMLAINHSSSNLFSVLLLALPLLIDCGLAVIDEDFQQAFHDRVSNTLVIPTRRGFSLDLRLKKLWLTWKRKNLR